jgi:APA family basic amino acid/polyamine antiporter
LSQSPSLPQVDDDFSSSHGPGLLRALGPGMAMAIVVGNVIGSGIYVKPGAIARQAGDFGVIVVAWIAGGLVCLMGALCFAELGAMLPRAGGLYVYLREAYGRPIAFLYGWTDFFFSRPASIGALSVIFVGTVMQLAGVNAGPLTELGVQIATIVAMAWVNILGVIWGGRVQGLTTIAKAGFLAGVALLPWLLGLFGVQPLDMANLASTVTPEKPGLSSRFAVALLGVLWAYNGWEALGSVAEEIRQPQRNIPRALAGGMGVLIVLYVSANIAYHVALPMSAIAGAGTEAAQTMFQALLGPPGITLMTAGIMLSTFSGINSNMLLGPRVSFAMGRDGVFFRGLGSVHVSFRTPSVAIAVQALMSIALIIGSSILVRSFRAFAHTNVFDVLTDYVVFASSIFYLLGVLAVLILRRTQPDLPRPYRTTGYPFVPLIYAGFYLWFLAEVYRDQPAQANIGLGLVALGIPVYAAWCRAVRGRGNQTARMTKD